jgi:hypothetical protein
MAKESTEVIGKSFQNSPLKIKKTSLFKVREARAVIKFPLLR